MKARLYIIAAFCLMEVAVGIFAVRKNRLFNARFSLTFLNFSV